MKISPAQSDFLNWSRWVAAWLVVAEHARSLIFVDYGELQSPGLLAKGFYFLTGFGHEAVMVFFVISGYLVGGKVWSLYREGRFGWRRYLADRASRLYAVLFVALLLGAAMDWTGYLFFNKYGLYNQGYEGSIAVLGAAPIERMGWRDFLVNAFFLQTIVGPTFGSNGPLWSLAYEWWYYVLFPLALAAVWPMVDGGWRFLKGDRRTAQLSSACTSRAKEIGDRGEATMRPIADSGGLMADGSKLVPSSATWKALDAGRVRQWNVQPVESEKITPPAKHIPTGSTLDATPRRCFLIGAGSLLAVAGLCWFLTWEILIFFGVWLLGVAVAVLQPRTDNRRLIADGSKLVPSSATGVSLDAGRSTLDSSCALALDSRPSTLVSSSFATRALSALFFGSVLLLARAEVLKVPYGWQYLLGVAFALVLVSLANGSRRWVWSKPSAYLADFSYSVYLIHFPVLMLVVSVAFSLTGYGIKIPFGVGGLIWFVVVFVLAILFAWMVSLVTEARTAQLREVLYRIFGIEPRITPINTK